MRALFPERAHFPTALTLIGDSFVVLGRSARTTMPVALCCGVSFGLAQFPVSSLLVGWMSEHSPETIRLFVGAETALLTSTGVQLATAVLASLLEDARRGERGDAARAFSRGLGRLPAAAGLSITLAVPAALGMQLLTVPGTQRAGYLLLALALIAAVPFGSAMSVAVVEARGLLAAMKRSAALTEGYIVALAIARSAAGFVVGALIVLARIPVSATPWPGVLAGIISVTLLALTLGTQNYVLYHRLREAHDGAQPDATVSAFD
ncbi:MAG: hypothetical protein HZA61_12320 [Candidatus Eisenbacteria bacterium]|uniref:Uncharacterized protein n=1 Tax=Eiseniibacteriota bacterium TaxID=2212470 RepID=A0A933SCZ2_UNCEI|nr:hypothetical protein [Candidatus Eisenbacteria bacterium]